MKKRIKKTFLDILFEPEEDEIEIFPDEESVKKTKAFLKDTSNKTEMNAKDVLYRKSETSAFIDLDEKPVVKKEIEEKKNNEYEFSNQISPMFGVLSTDEKKKVTKVEKKVVNESYINKPDDSHLEIITSPIYGYGPQEDSKETAEEVLDEQELHELLDEEEVETTVEDDFADHVYVEYNDDDEDEINLFSSYGDDE